MTATITGSGVNFSDGTVQNFKGYIRSVNYAQTSAVQTWAATSTWQDTALSVTVTPKDASSKFLLVLTGMHSDSSYSGNSAYMMTARLLRNGSLIAIGNQRGNIVQGLTGGGQTYGSGWTKNWSAQYLDAPATTAAITYKIQVYPSYNSLAVGGSYSTTSAAYINGTMNLTVFEIG